MKKLGFILVLTFCLVVHSNASALNVENPSGTIHKIVPGVSSAKFENGWNNGVDITGDVRMRSIGGGNLRQLNLKFSNPIINHSLLALKVSYSLTVSTTGYIQYRGFIPDSGWVLISQDCVGPTSIFNSSSNTHQTNLECTYLLYNGLTTDHLETVEDGRIAYYGYSGNPNILETYSDVIVQSAYSLELHSYGLNDDDRAWLEEHMPSGTSTADIESAIESAREEEKSEYEEQQEDVDSGADDAGEEAEAATSSLIDTGKSIIETIRDTPATNCVIRVKSGAFDTGNLNLCNVPQPIRTVISTIITIPVTLAALHIAYTTVIFYLNTVRKEQE